MLYALEQQRLRLAQFLVEKMCPVAGSPLSEFRPLDDGEERHGPEFALLVILNSQNSKMLDYFLNEHYWLWDERSFEYLTENVVKVGWTGAFEVMFGGKAFRTLVRALVTNDCEAAITMIIRLFDILSEANADGTTMLEDFA